MTLCCDTVAVPAGGVFPADTGDVVKVCDQPTGHGGSHSGGGWRWSG